MDWIKDRFAAFAQTLVATGEFGSVTYADFLLKISAWEATLQDWSVQAGDRVGLIAEYHIEVVALLQALLARGCIVIPLATDDHSVYGERLQVACATKVIRLTDYQIVTAQTVICNDITPTEQQINPLLIPLISQAKPGFIIYTSGSTGKSKAVLLEYERMIRKYKKSAGKPLRTLLFLKLDHIGGLNTLFATLFNGGTLVSSGSRQAKDVCRCIEAFAVELLPTTPSFLNMLLLSKMHKHYDFSSLKIVTYGTEVMPASTLAALYKLLPGIELKQTYGLSELGILSTQSKSSESKWMKIGGEGFLVKVKDNVLWIKSDQAMLGYLNAESPFDDEGWYNTGDRVEVDGDYFRILGRESEIINVAGEKVFPIEIESYLLTLANVKDVVVRAKPSPIVGQIVWAEFVLQTPEELTSFRQRIIAACQAQFPAYKVPGLITFSSEKNLVGSRFKKIRHYPAAAPC